MKTKRASRDVGTSRSHPQRITRRPADQYVAGDTRRAIALDQLSRAGRMLIELDRLRAAFTERRDYWRRQLGS